MKYLSWDRAEISQIIVGFFGFLFSFFKIKISIKHKNLGYYRIVSLVEKITKNWKFFF